MGHHRKTQRTNAVSAGGRPAREMRSFLPWSLFLPARLVWVLLVSALAAGCPLPGSWTPADEGGDSGVIEESSALFEPVEGLPGVRDFWTNDTRYEGGDGHTFWTPVGDVLEPFREQAAALTKFCGNGRAGYGIVFCHGTAEDGRESMLTAMINTAGEFIVGEVTGAAFTALIPWTACSWLKTGYNQRNEVRVTLSDGTFALRLNGRATAEFEDSEPPFHETGRGGFIAVISPLDEFPESPVHVRFEEL